LLEAGGGDFFFFFLLFFSRPGVPVVSCVSKLVFLADDSTPVGDFLFFFFLLSVGELLSDDFFFFLLSIAAVEVSVGLLIGAVEMSVDVVSLVVVGSAVDTVSLEDVGAAAELRSSRRGAPADEGRAARRLGSPDCRRRAARPHVAMPPASRGRRGAPCSVARVEEMQLLSRSPEMCLAGCFKR